MNKHIFLSFVFLTSFVHAHISNEPVYNAAYDLSDEQLNAQVKEWGLSEQAISDARKDLQKLKPVAPGVLRKDAIKSGIFSIAALAATVAGAITMMRLNNAADNALRSSDFKEQFRYEHLAILSMFATATAGIATMIGALFSMCWWHQANRCEDMQDLPVSNQMIRDYIFARTFIYGGSLGPIPTCNPRHQPNWSKQDILNFLANY